MNLLTLPPPRKASGWIAWDDLPNGFTLEGTLLVWVGPFYDRSAAHLRLDDGREICLGLPNTLQQHLLTSLNHRIRIYRRTKSRGLALDLTRGDREPERPAHLLKRLWKKTVPLCGGRRTPHDWLLTQIPVYGSVCPKCATTLPSTPQGRRSRKRIHKYQSHLWSPKECITGVLLKGPPPAGAGSIALAVDGIPIRKACPGRLYALLHAVPLGTALSITCTGRIGRGGQWHFTVQKENP